MRVSRLIRSRDEAEGAVFDGDGGVALDDDSPIEGNGVAIGGSNARAGGAGNARNGAKIGELSPQPTYARVGHSGHAADEATPDVAIDKNALATLGFFVPDTGGRDGGRSGRRTVDTIACRLRGAAEINGFDPAALFKDESPPKLDDDSPPKLTPRPSDASRMTRSEPVERASGREPRERETRPGGRGEVEGGTPRQPRMNNRITQKYFRTFESNSRKYLVV
jgi:hypothetical protein